MKHSNVLQGILHHAKTNPSKNVFSHIEGRSLDKMAKIDMTYHELLVKSHFLSIEIIKHTKSGDRVLLCYPTGLDFIVSFYACSLAKVIAVPVVIPSNLGLEKKFTTILEDAEPSLLLTDLKTKAQYFQVDSFKKNNIDCLTTNTFEFCSEINLDNYQLPLIAVDDTALLQYTSGSTADPKGVIVTHGNLIDNIHLMTQAYQFNPQDVGITWLPHTHDMGLIGCLLSASYVGCTLFIMSQSAFVRAPIFWLTLISHFHITTAMSPNFALMLCLKRFKPEKSPHLKLAHLKCFIIGAEPISADVLEKFTTVFSKFGFKRNVFAPSYGLAETTLMVSSRLGVNTLQLDHNNRKIVSCGPVFQTVKIVHANSHQECCENEVGEIWVSGHSVTQGYWHKEDVTKTVYRCHLANDEGLYFRTGDLGFLHKDELYITGRIKELIIVNGLNYYPQDIESCVQKSDAKLEDTSVAAFAYRPIEQDDTDSFVVLLKKQNNMNDAELAQIRIKARMAIMQAFQLIPHDIQFIAKSFPKTTSGKVQRSLCVELYEDIAT